MKASLTRWIVAVAILLIATSSVAALPRIPRPWENQRLNKQLHGTLVDFTANHGVDRRMWSPALQERRDLYVYLPPGYDGKKQYPLVIWLHGFSQDEKSNKKLAKAFDAAIATGKVPPMIFAVPDGTFRGYPSMRNSGSFYINGVNGRYEDYLAHDVWNFLMCRFAIRPEREAHALVGASMGGTSAFALAFKHKEKFGVIAGIMPLLDLLYADCHGNHFANFRPDCIGRITNYNPRDLAGRFWGVPIRYGQAMTPVFGSRENVMARLPTENPVEMLSLYNVQPGEFEMFIAYGGRDQFNGDAENESFRYFAAGRGIDMTVEINPNGRHSRKTAWSFFDVLCQWLAVRFAPYAPQ